MSADATSQAASWFLRIASISVVIVFALPLLLAPMRWARAFGWKTPSEPHESALAVYLGRCLGALALALAIAALRASVAPRAHRAIFGLVFAASSLMVAVHVLGAVEGRQPRSETYEIGLYVALAAASAGF